MSERTVEASLSPLERLHLRDALQDRWRTEVERITWLSVDLHTALDDGWGPNPDPVDPTPIATALSEARLHLAEIEDAMRRLDDRSYGRCGACLMPIGLARLSEHPESRYCTECRPAADAPLGAAMARVG
jgi:hypothetical protein